MLYLGQPTASWERLHSQWLDISPTTWSTDSSHFVAMCCRPAGRFVSGAGGVDTSNANALPHVSKTLLQPQPLLITPAAAKAPNSADISPPTGVGRIARCFDFWNHVLKTSDFILNIIKSGYIIPFVSEPPSCNLKNNVSSLKHEQFVRAEIEDLLAKGYVHELTEAPFAAIRSQ